MVFFLERSTFRWVTEIDSFLSFLEAQQLSDVANIEVMNVSPPESDFAGYRDEILDSSYDSSE
jgi:hypothetical protein